MFEWTSDIKVKMRALWDEGVSTAEIGRRIGTTKNAVVGKAHRLNFPSRPNPCHLREERSVPQGRRVPTPGLERQPGGRGVGPTLVALGVGLAEMPAAPRPVIAVPLPRPVPAMPVLTRRPSCWPLWGNNENPTHRYCEAPGVPGRSYCAEHGARAWVRLEPRSPAQVAADDSRRVKAMARGADGVPWAAG